MHMRGRHMGWSHLLVCGLVILAAALAVGFFGLGVAGALIIGGAFCALMMVSMIWMMVAMGKGAMHRR